MNQQCPLGHDAYVIGYCFNPRCSERMACPQCILDVHKTHRRECYLFDEVNEHIDRLIIKYKQLNVSKLKEQLELTCSDLSTQFNRIVNDIKEQVQGAYVKIEESVQNILEILDLFKRGAIDFKLAFSALELQRLQNIELEISLAQSMSVKKFQKKVSDLVPDFTNKQSELISLVYDSNLKEFFLQNPISEIPIKYRNIKGQPLDHIKSFECNKKYFWGEWKYDKPHGFGTVVELSIPYILQGVWEKGDFKWGAGYYIIKNVVAMYQAPYEKYQANGVGMWKSSNGDIYEGDLVNNSRTGNGVYKFHNGDTYVGEFKDNYHHGNGIYTFKDGSRMKGTWIEHKKEGQFDIYKPNEDVVWQSVTFIQNKQSDLQPNMNI